MEKVDTRIQYTKKVLKESLLVILQDKPISKVSIKEVCDHAGLNRGTFYLHYHEPNDLLKEIEEDFISEHLGRFSTYMKAQHDTSVFSKLFISMIENKDLCLTLMGSHGAPQFTERIKNMIWPIMLEDWKRDFPRRRRQMPPPPRYQSLLWIIQLMHRRAF